VDAFLSGADAVVQVLRTVLLWIALVFGAICVLDWAVRTRKISPFNAIARFCRSTIDPFIAPIERKVVRAGGTPAAAPLWALAAVVVGGILLLSFMDLARIEDRVAGRIRRHLPSSGELDVQHPQDRAGGEGDQLLATHFALFRMGEVELCAERADTRAHA